jgi:hypothetical protein
MTADLETLKRIENKLDKFDSDVVPTVHQNNGTVRVMKWIGGIVAGCALAIALMVLDVTGYITKHKYESDVGFSLINENNAKVETLIKKTDGHEFRIQALEHSIKPGP